MPENRYYQPLPADFVLLDKLPDKGMVGGLRWRGRRLRDVRTELLDEARESLEGQDLLDFEAVLTPNFVFARVRAMHVAELVEPFGSSGSGDSGNKTAIWARTDKGREFLARKEEVLGQ
jgi:hypothetical protein